jgi:hypothetical protein
MKTMVIAVLFFALIIAAHGAASAEEGETTISLEGFSFVLPDKWSVPKEEQPRGRRKNKERIVLITRDGIPLNNVVFNKRLGTAEFDYTKRRLSPDMMPQEMAGVVLNDFELNKDMKNLRVIENKPSTIAGLPGFRLVFSYRREGTLQYQCVYYGFKKEDMYYNVLFAAPKRHYFNANAGTFEQIIKSLKLDEQSEGFGSGGGI